MINELKTIEGKMTAAETDAIVWENRELVRRTIRAGEHFRRHLQTLLEVPKDIERYFVRELIKELKSQANPAKLFKKDSAVTLFHNAVTKNIQAVLTQAGYRGLEKETKDLLTNAREFLTYARALSDKLNAYK